MPYISENKREKLASEGDALPDGSFPIRNTNDLHNAIRDYGRAKDPARAKAHIEKRTKELGATHILPQKWDMGTTKKAVDSFEVYKQLIAILPRKVEIKSSDKQIVVPVPVQVKAEEGLEGLAKEYFHSAHSPMIRSLIAHKASMGTDKPSRLSKDALEAAQDGHNGLARELHRSAALHHGKAMKTAGNFIERSAHEEAAKAHDLAADHHIATLLKLGKPLELTDYDDRESKALDTYERYSKAGKSDEWISDKISKIMKEGVKGKKVGHKQAIAIAYSMAGRGSKALDSEYATPSHRAYIASDMAEKNSGRDVHGENGHPAVDALSALKDGMVVGAALEHSKAHEHHMNQVKSLEDASLARSHETAAQEHKDAAVCLLNHAISCLENYKRKREGY